MRTWPRSAVWISALAIGIFQVVGSYGAAHNQTDRKPIDAFALVLVLAGPIALAVRDRWPVPVAAVAIGAAVVSIGSGYPYGPIFVSAVVALFSAVQAGHRAQVIAVAVLGYVGFVVATVVDPRGDDASGLWQLALVAGWLVVVLAVAEVVRVRHDQRAEQARVREEEEQRRVGEQRLALARELHDVLAHNISLINVQASVALHLLDTRFGATGEPGAGEPGGVGEGSEAGAGAAAGALNDRVPAGDREGAVALARPALAEIKAASHEALHELRTALDLLRHGEEAPRTPQPRLADLDDLVAGVRASGLVVHLDHDRATAPLPAATDLAAYRVVQEALTNVTRHARAHTVVVRVRDEGATGAGGTGRRGVSIEVLDDGVGGAAVPGNGLRGMAERAAALGGTVTAGPRAEGGFRVLAHLPADVAAGEPITAPGAVAGAVPSEASPGSSLTRAAEGSAGSSTGSSTGPAAPSSPGRSEHPS